MQLLFSSTPSSRLIKVYRSFLASACLIGATEIQVEAEDVDLLPEPASGEAFILRVGDDADAEELIITGRSGTTLTCQPTVKAWTYNSPVAAVISPYMLGRFVQRDELGDSAGLDVGTTAGTVAAGNDARFGTVTSAKLIALDGLTWAANKLILLTGSATASLLSCASWAQSFISAADTAAGRTALGLGGSATKDVGTGSGNVAAGDHTHSTLANSIEIYNVESSAVQSISQNTTTHLSSLDTAFTIVSTEDILQVSAVLHFYKTSSAGTYKVEYSIDSGSNIVIALDYQANALWRAIPIAFVLSSLSVGSHTLKFHVYIDNGTASFNSNSITIYSRVTAVQFKFA